MQFVSRSIYFYIFYLIQFFYPFSNFKIMSQSTPLNMLRRRNDEIPQQSMHSMHQQQQSMHSMPLQQQMQMHTQMPMQDNGGNLMAESQLVEDILKEMGEGPGVEHQSNINSQAFQYAMDSSQVPPTKYNPPTNMHYPSDGSEYTQKLMADSAPNGLLSSIGINLSSASLKDKIMNNIKYPILVFIICFLISLPEFNRFLFGFFPRLLLESGQVSIGGVILKAVVGMLLYTCIVIFI